MTKPPREPVERNHAPPDAQRPAPPAKGLHILQRGQRFARRESGGGTDLAINRPSTLESLTEPAFIARNDHRILVANRAYCERFNGGKSVCGQLCHEISHGLPVPCEQTGLVCPMTLARQSGRHAQALHVHHDGKGEVFETTWVFPLHDTASASHAYLEILTPSAIASAQAEKETGLVGRSRPFLDLLNLISRVAPTTTTVLLLGESGTGKELIARALHKMSPRAHLPFVPVECSGLTETLFESELFGHERGSFTGAHSRKQGLVEAADGGTLFLDEIGDIPLSLQVKLLRLLETGVFRRVGGVELLRSDFRLVCATHRDLTRLVAERSFREDLYYRISAFPVPLPPLRERAGDLEVLATSIFGRLGCEDRCRLSEEAVEALRSYAFPGNVRELFNVLERGCLLADDGVIRRHHLPEGCYQLSIAERQELFPLDPSQVVPLETLESRYIRWLSQRFDGNRSELAERLGISERTLYRKMQVH